MHLIAVDIGNSASKLAFNQNADTRATTDRLIEPAIRWFGDTIPDDLTFRLPQGPCAWWIASVHAKKQETLRHWIEKHRPSDQVHSIQHDSIPIESAVDHREQVGKDRLLAALAALDLVKKGTFSNAAGIVVIDAGTAVTVDYVDAKGIFQGGNIFLGADAILGQISSRTDALPNLDYISRMARLKDLINESNAKRDDRQLPPLPIGKNTIDAILSGVYRSQWAALKDFVSQFALAAGTIASQTRNDGPAVIVTGGGWFELAYAIPSLSHENDLDWHQSTKPWIVDPNLVLRGVALAGIEANQNSRNAKERGD